MNNLLGISLICLVLAAFTGCNNSILKERVQVIDEVSVLMPKEFKKNELGNGEVLIRSKVGSTDLRVTVINDTSLNTLNIDKLKEGLEINVARFLQPMKGQLLQRKDYILGNLVMSDFEFELGSQESTRHGVGRFLINGNSFISFLFVTPKQELKSNEAVREAFFNSIQVK